MPNFDTVGACKNTVHFARKWCRASCMETAFANGIEFLTGNTSNARKMETTDARKGNAIQIRRTSLCGGGRTPARGPTPRPLFPRPYYVRV